MSNSVNPKDPWYVFFPNVLRRIGRIMMMKKYLRKHRNDPEPEISSVFKKAEPQHRAHENGYSWKEIEMMDAMPDDDRKTPYPASVHDQTMHDATPKYASWGTPDDINPVPKIPVYNYGDEFFDDANSEMHKTWNQLKAVIDKRDAEVAKFGYAEPKTIDDYNILHQRFDELDKMLHMPPVPRRNDVKPTEKTAKLTEKKVDAIRATFSDTKNVSGGLLSPDAIIKLTTGEKHND